MSLAEQMPLADVKNRLSEIVERIEREHGRVVITKHGRPAVVVVSIDDLESLEETLAVMSDPAAMADIRASAEERSSGVPPMALDRDAALKLITRR
jgi:antitoxin YefM